MHKTIHIVLILLCLSGCTRPQSGRQTPNDKPRTASAESPKEEDFLAFFRKFSSDSAFQSRHITFPLEVIRLGCEDEPCRGFFILSDEWRYTDFDDSVMSGEKVFTEVNSKERTAVIRGCDTGISITCFFRFDKKTWLLHKIEDASN